MTLDAYPQAAAAGLIEGIIAGWRRGANPGALDDMTVSPLTLVPNGVLFTLLFANGEVFVIRCTRIDP